MNERIDRAEFLKERRAVIHREMGIRLNAERTAHARARWVRRQTRLYQVAGILLLMVGSLFAVPGGCLLDYELPQMAADKILSPGSGWIENPNWPLHKMIDSGDGEFLGGMIWRVKPGEGFE